MSTKQEQFEYEALSIMSQSVVPVGSSALSILMRKAGLNISAATIGRQLSDFDYSGMTTKHGFRGRTITESGRVRLAELREKLKWQDLSAKFYKTLDVQTKDNLIDILTARRGIEREIARLAAIKSTPSDISLIREAFEMQSEKAASGGLIFDSDLVFHRAVAAASKNEVLAAAYDFIWQNGKLSPVMEYIRMYVNGKIVIDHSKILSAIEANSPQEAELLMVSHIESLIDDVQQYWNLAMKG